MKAVTLLAILAGTSHAFTPTGSIAGRSLPSLRPTFSTNADSTSSPSTALYGAKRRGKLANNVSFDDDGNVRVITNKQKQKFANKPKRGAGRNSKKEDGATTISPLLAEWAKEGSTTTTADDEDTTASPLSSSAKSSSVVTTSDVFVPFDDDDDSSKGKKKRRNNKKSSSGVSSGGILLTPTQSSQMDDILDIINEQLSTTNCDVNELVSNIASLVQLGSTFGGNDQILLPTLKSILSTKEDNAKNNGDGKKRPSYRLAWVGSDDAICHIGTSLHKVPLARLQEIYLLLGYNRWELLEVIRILGPFPNVRNTLQGDLKVKKLNDGKKKREGVRMEIAYNSMTDGTGKEILAGKDDNVKRVALDVWFANDKAIVCTTVNEEGDDDDDDSSNGDPLSGSGSKILYFVAEENVDEQLEKLRAA